MKLKVKHRVIYKRPPYGRRVAFNNTQSTRHKLIRAGCLVNDKQLAIFMRILGDRHSCRLLIKNRNGSIKL